MVKFIPNFLRNSAEIVKVLDTYRNRFNPREGDTKHTSIIPNLSSRFKTLHDKDMSSVLIDLIFKDSDFDEFLRDSYSFIQIQKYEPGDFIIPHKDVYEIRTLHLITLTTSEVDGLVIEDGKGGLIKKYDEAGTKIEFSNEYHWVDPVKTLRYSLVIGD